MKTTILTCIVLTTSLHAGKFTEGTLTFTVQRGERTETYRMLKKTDRIRIDCPGKHIPLKPYNLIDPTTGDLTIVRPMNSTYTVVPAKLWQPRKVSAVPQPPAPPAGTGPRITPPGTPAVGPAPGANQPSGKAIVPKMPNKPKMPDMPRPTLPDGSPLPAGVGPRPGGDSTPPGTAGNPAAPAVPNMPSIPGAPNIPGVPSVPGGGMPMAPPAMPQIPGMPGSNNEIKLTQEKQTRKIHGFLCTRYTLEIPRTGVITIWASDSTDLPPFHLLEYDAPNQRGRIDWRSQWPALLREKNLFPMLAILHQETQRRRPGSPKAPTDTGKKQNDQEKTKAPRELGRWEVKSIDPKAINQPDLFQTPKNYHPLQVTSF